MWDTSLMDRKPIQAVETHSEQDQGMCKSFGSWRGTWMTELQNWVLRSNGSTVEGEVWLCQCYTCLENSLQNTEKNHVINHAKDCLCETKHGLHALVLAWHGPPPQALAGEREACQLQNWGYNTFPWETQDGSWLLTATWMGPDL